MELYLDPHILYDPEILEQTADILKNEIVGAQVIPKSENGGELEQSLEAVMHPEERRAEIAVGTPYARYQYYGIVMLGPNGSAYAKRGEKKRLTGKKLRYYHGENAHAKDHWFADWEPGGVREDRAAEIYSALFRQKYGGGS